MVHQQAAYARASTLMFAAVDRHNTPLVIHYDHKIVDPIFAAIENVVYARGGVSAALGLRQSDLLRRRTASARDAISIAFGIGLLLLGAFSSILLGLRRRVSIADRAEIERLGSVALVDSLTGLRNHRAFHEDLAGLLGPEARGRGPLALVMFDLNGLKAVNDSLGHQAGDDRLRKFAGTLGASCRDGDYAYRVGGDEFALILRDLFPWDAVEATQRIHATLAAQAIAVTAGIAQTSGRAEIDAIIREADLSLIDGKRHHHDVTLYSPDLEPRIAAAGDARDAEYVSSLSSALALAVDSKDFYTRSHSRTVSQLCVLIASELHLDPEMISQMRLAGLLHDVGKIGIPDVILTKPAALTDAEFDQMKQHAVLGEQIVAAANLPTEAQWIRHHHERYDGNGYPDRLAGDNIPLQSRIIFVADAFEAMTSDRPYRKAPGRDFAIAELQDNAGTQFDSAIVQALCHALGSVSSPSNPSPRGPGIETPAAATPGLLIAA
jgi:diguanylate cyclase (GGDEF)-like protein/putative nucleotidyltransferase with HDIG domain